MQTSIGTGVFVLREGFELLIGRRSQKNKRAPGVWALPGGMREDYETIAACAQREVYEETTLEIKPYTYGELQECVLGVSDHFPREPHITCWVAAHYNGGSPKVVEPEKCDVWEWHTPTWIFRYVPQVDEQRYWTPYEIWKRLLCERMGFPSF
jgi:8-oxo-dGTP diphosphatase